MFNIKEFVNKITDKGGRKPSDSSSVHDHVDHLSAEGFLCPPCMKAFPSPEALEEHYIKAHPIENAKEPEIGDDDLIQQDDALSDAFMQEVLQLQLSDPGGFGASLEAEEKARKEVEELNAALKQEVKLLHGQLRDEEEQLVRLRSEQDVLKEKLLTLAGQNDELTASNNSLRDQLDQRQTVVESSVTGIRDELEVLRKSKEVAVEEKLKEIDLLKSKIVELEANVRENVRLHQEAYRELQSTKSNVKSLEEENRKLKDDLIASAQTVKHKDEACNAALNKCEQSEARLEKLTKEVLQASSSSESAVTSYLAESETLRKELDSIRVERDTVRRELEVTQNERDAKLREIEVLKKEYEGSSAELEVANKKHEEAKKNLVVKSENLQIQVAELENKLKSAVEGAEQKSAELSSKLAEKEVEVNQLRHELQHMANSKDTELNSLKASLKNAEEEKKSLEQIVHDLREENAQVQSLLSTSESSLSALQAELTKTSTKYVELEKQYSALKSDSAERESASKKLEEELAAQISSSSQKLTAIEGLLQERSQKLTRVQQELDSSKTSHDAAMKSKSNEINALKSSLEEKGREMESVRKGVKDNQEMVAQRDERIAVLEERIVEMEVVNNELKFKLKSNEEEKALLADRCLAEQSKAESSQEAYDECKKKLDDTVAALHELGRENQSLQMESAKLQGRKWADDSLANNCTNCGKEFTLTIRKHHCRHCGQIFCNDCSARSASVPSSKKPVRVCDSCYNELVSK